MKRSFVKLWQGKYSLAVTFWLFLILGTFLVPIIVAILTVILILPLRFTGVPTWPITSLSVIAAIYPVIAAVGVWRSANAHRWPVTRVAAKIGVCAWFLILFLWIAFHVITRP